ncbi:hypothetical protein ACOL22_12580, partial [Aliarcobacter butzleri]
SVSSNLALLTANHPWKNSATDSYETTYFFEAETRNFTLPNSEVNLWNQDLLVDSSQLSPSLVRYSGIGKSDGRFSNIIA